MGRCISEGDQLKPITEIGRYRARVYDVDSGAMELSGAGSFVLYAEYLHRMEELAGKLDILNRRIETLIGVTCKQCERGDPLFIEPSTKFYTHRLGGNYCSAHQLHSLLDTKVSQDARAALRKGL